MKALLKRVLDNFDAALAIIMSIVAGGFGVFGGSASISILLSAISGTLALIAFGLVRERFARDQLLHNVSKLDESLQIIQGRPGADVFLKDRSAYVPLPETIATAKQICFLGPSLINIFSQWVGYLHYEKLDKDGANIQILLLDPDSSTAVSSAANFMNATAESLHRDITSTISHVDSMLKDSSRKGSISLKLTSASPNISMILIDPDEPNGKIIIEFIGYHSRIYERPHIELSRHRDGKWYEFFLKQYRQLWEDSALRLTSEVKR